MFVLVELFYTHNAIRFMCISFVWFMCVSFVDGQSFTILRVKMSEKQNNSCSYVFKGYFIKYECFPNKLLCSKTKRGKNRPIVVYR